MTSNTVTVNGTSEPEVEVVAPAQEDAATDTKSSGPTPAAIITETSTKPAKITLHHINQSRSQRILWLLEELEIPYEVKTYERKSDMRAPPSLREVHPLGKAPIITDGNMTLAESGAIIEYLIGKYGENFRPLESGKIDDLYFTHYAEGSLMPMVVNKLIFVLIPQEGPALLRPLLKYIFKTVDKVLYGAEIKYHCAMIDLHLNKCQTGWIAGGDHPTAADFMMVFALEMLILREGRHATPKIREYVTRIQERPAYQRALEKSENLNKK